MIELILFPTSFNLKIKGTGFDFKTFSINHIINFLFYAIPLVFNLRGILRNELIESQRQNNLCVSIYLPPF